MPGKHSCRRRGLSAASAVLSGKCSAISAISRGLAIIARLPRKREQRPPPHPTRLRTSPGPVLGGSALRSGLMPMKTCWALLFGRKITHHDFAAAASTGAAVKNDSNNESSVDQCGDFPNTGSNWPAARVEQILQLSDAQHESLEKMQMAVAQSIKNIRADCRGSGTLAPPDRLSALVQTLWTVRDAGISMRGPLKNFHDTLTNTQKDSFAGHQPQNGSPPDPKTASNGMNKQFQACASQNAEKAERMIKEIEMKIRPNKDQ